MRRGVPRHDPRPLRALGSARGTAGALRRFARRQQGGERSARGPGIRLRRARLPARAGESVRPPFPDDRLLEFQPLRRSRRRDRADGAHQRPGRGPAQTVARGVRRGFHRRLPGVPARPGIQPRRQPSERSVEPALAPRQGAVAAFLRRRGDAAARRSGAGDPHPVQGVRGRCPDPPQRHAHDAVADRPRRGVGRAGRAHLVAADLHRPHGGQALAGGEFALLLARGHPADDVFRPAFRRRHRQPGRLERPRSADDLGRVRHQLDQRADDGRLRAGHAVLRPGAHARRLRHGGSQRRGAAYGVAGPRGQQPPPAQGRRRPRRRVGERHPHDRDAEGERRRGRLFHPVVRAAHQDPRRAAEARRADGVAERRPAAADGAFGGGDPGDRRAAHSRRRAHGRRAGGVPGAGAQFRGASRRPRALRRRAANHQGRDRPPRRCPQLQGRRAGGAGPQRAHREPAAGGPRVRPARQCDLRLQRQGGAADREFQPVDPSQSAHCAGGRVGQREIHPRQADLRSAPAMVGDGQHRRPQGRGHSAQPFRGDRRLYRPGDRPVRRQRARQCDAVEPHRRRPRRDPGAARRRHP